MIIPKEFQFMSDADAREKMTAYIRKHFSGILGSKINLIDAPNGLELIRQEVKAKKAEAGMDREVRRERHLKIA